MDFCPLLATVSITTWHDLMTLIHTLINIWLDCCNTFYTAQPLETIQILQLVLCNVVSKFQLVQPCHCRMIFTGKSLYWLPVHFQFVKLLFTHIDLGSIALRCIRHHLVQMEQAYLAQTSWGVLLRNPTWEISRMWSMWQVFSIVLLLLWNLFSTEVHIAPSIQAFCKIVL